MPDRSPLKAEFFIPGLLVGLIVGGIALTLTVFIGVGVLATNEGGNVVAPLLAAYAVAIVLGLLGILGIRKGVSFWSGIALGCAVGMLGWTTVCTLMSGGGFGNG